MNKKRRFNFQKTFSFISFIFLLTCVCWYGGRTVYFYLQSKQEAKSDTVTLIKRIKIKELKEVKKDYYFYGQANNNYVTYSNLTWRILKITNNNEIVLILDKPIITLAYGEDVDYKDSYITNWLNKTEDENTGILESKLNNINLINTITCLDKIDNIEKTSCNEKNEDNKLGLPSLTDYINSGATKSFINNGYYTYLSNKNSNNEIWYITENGKLNTSDGTEILGVKPVITLPSNTPLIKGKGTNKEPYIIEEKSSYFASYVKLDKDIWRVYDEDDNNIKLVLNDYLKENSNEFTHNYSQNNYYHNDTQPNTLANYLNQTYLNNLSYKNIINTDYYTNYFYSYNNNYDYKDILTNKVDTKVSIPSITDPILNNELDQYLTNTGTGKNDKYIYIINKNGSTETVSTTKESKIVPCISIKKNLITKGTGNINEPYETE